MAEDKKLKLISLGGLGEVGKNMLVLEYDEHILVIDAGLMFPEEEMLGIDIVLPDFTYLKENREKVQAIVLTHGHEDHVGALPYVLRDINVPVYGTKLTLGLVQGKLEEYGLTDIDLREIDPEIQISIGPFDLDFARVCHSIPDGLGMAIHTPAGTIVHSGDFKFDQTPIDGKGTDFNKFSSFGKRKVLALLSDSTNSELAGNTRSEREVGEALLEIFQEAPQRIIVASFASHIHRIQQVVDVSVATGRKIAITGRSMQGNVGIATDLGYLKIPDEMLIDINEINAYSPREVVILCTGSQGEPLSALARMASHDHKFVQIEEGDSVIISARPVPGNEKSVSRIIDRLFKRGARVYYQSISGVHVSGHAAREELKLMINLVSPKFFIPIHGEYRHLKHHADIAVEVGIPPENIFLIENGDVIEFDDGAARVNGRVNAGIVLVDGLGVGDIRDIVLRDRQLLATDGVLIVVVGLNVQNGALVSGPDIITRGFVYVKEATDLIEEAQELVQAVFERTAKEQITDWSVLKSDVRGALSRFLYARTKRRPMIMPIIVEV